MRSRFILFYLYALALLVPVTTFAEPAGLSAAFEAAWQRSPQARTLQARRDEVAAGRDASASWIAGSPALGLSQRSGQWTNQSGNRETEVSVSAPVWLPGQRAARSSLAQASADDLEAQLLHLRLTVAGEVRERAWAVAAAREAFTEAEHHEHHLQMLAEEVMRRVKAGDLARTDGMLAQQEVLAARNSVATAQAKLQDALMRFRLLTGLPEIPEMEPEILGKTAIEPHPRLAAARTALQKSQSSMQLANSIRAEPPTVGLSMRREQDTRAGDPVRSVGIAVQIPIGTAARNRPLEAAARTQVETASAEAAQAELAIQADIDLARQQVETAGTGLQAATSRVELAKQHTELIEKAFRLGERGLAELLRSQLQLHEAQVAERQQKVAVGLAHAKLNQALGILP
jgi:outer membrane protein, heavy metal efflux system